MKISESQLDELKNLQNDYKEMLFKYQEFTKLSDNEIEMLIDGYLKRIECLIKALGQ